MENQKKEYLRKFINLYWLRPETALWRTLDCMAMHHIDFIQPVLDVGCGDGLFSFIRAGGELSSEYDMFLQVGELDSFFKNEDIYNFFDQSAIKPVVMKKPAYSIALGIDHKESLLKKASLLGCYEKTTMCDVSQPLPIENSTFQTIFCNILYWLDNYMTPLVEFHRILTQKGRLVLTVPNNTFRDYCLYQRLCLKTGDRKWEWLHQLDRGRSENIKLCQSYEMWKNDFAKAGFTITQHRRYLSKTVIEAWDIGLRPISPFLIEMANNLRLDVRQNIKQKWIKQLMPFIEPICELDWFTDRANPPAFHLFVLEKK